MQTEFVARPKKSYVALVVPPLANYSPSSVPIKVPDTALVSVGPLLKLFKDKWILTLIFILKCTCVYRQCGPVKKS